MKKVSWNLQEPNLEGGGREAEESHPASDGMLRVPRDSETSFDLIFPILSFLGQASSFLLVWQWSGRGEEIYSCDPESCLNHQCMREPESA